MYVSVGGNRLLDGPLLTIVMHTVKQTKITTSLLVLHLPSLSFQLVLHYDIIFLTSMELGRYKISSFSSELCCRFYVGYYRYYCYYYYYYLK
jgi:hypothetical protein